MRIAILVPNYTPTGGGVYTIVQSLISELQTGNYFSNHELIFISSNKSIKDLFSNHPFFLLPVGKKKDFDIFRNLLSQFFNFLRYRRLIDFHLSKSSSLNNILSKARADILWSLDAWIYPVTIPYALHLWDLQHRIQPFFPEVANGSKWVKREHNVSVTLKRASIIFTGTERGKVEIINAYGLEKERIAVVPLPLPKLESKPSLERNQRLFFYPAQFWPHKNHVTLLKAFAKAKSELKQDLKLVLPGGDMGNLSHVKEEIKKLSLDSSVSLPGFISKDEMRNLFATSALMIYPSMFGPDNLPPLEAIAFECPVAVACVPGATEQYGMAVKYFSPTDVEAIKNLIIGVASSKLDFSKEKEEGARLVAERTVSSVVVLIERELIKFEGIIWNWKSI